MEASIGTAADRAWEAAADDETSDAAAAVDVTKASNFAFRNSAPLDRRSIGEGPTIHIKARTKRGLVLADRAEQERSVHMSVLWELRTTTKRMTHHFRALSRHRAWLRTMAEATAAASGRWFPHRAFPRSPLYTGWLNSIRDPPAARLEVAAWQNSRRDPPLATMSFSCRQQETGQTIREGSSEINTWTFGIK